MAVRNFWAEVTIEGQQTTLKGVPRSKDGGLTIKVYQRQDGEIVHPYTIRCEVAPNGRLVTKVEDGKGFTITQEFTDR